MLIVLLPDENGDNAMTPGLVRRQPRTSHLYCWSRRRR